MNTMAAVKNNRTKKQLLAYSTKKIRNWNLVLFFASNRFDLIKISIRVFSPPSYAVTVRLYFSSWFHKILFSGRGRVQTCRRTSRTSEVINFSINLWFTCMKIEFWREAVNFPFLLYSIQRQQDTKLQNPEQQ